MDIELSLLDAAPAEYPLAWVDATGQVWPLPKYSPIHIGVKYLFSQKDVAIAIKNSQAIEVNTPVMDVSVVARPELFDSSAPSANKVLTNDEVKAVRTMRKNVMTAFGTA